MKWRMNTSLFYKLLILSMLAAACGTKKANKSMAYVFTLVPAETVTPEAIVSGAYRYASGMQIALIEDGAAPEARQVITEEFYSARSPEVSFDGKSLIFSGQKNEGDVWQIWLYDMKKKRFSQVTQSAGDCTDPAWLPDGKIAYSKQVTEKDGLKHHAIFYIQPDGCCEQRITFQPHEDLNAMVMHDGRILFSSRQLKPERGLLKFLAMRPDGTKAELFCQPGASANAVGKASEAPGRQVMFPEDGRLISVWFNRPLHSRKAILENMGILQSAHIAGDKLLVCADHEKKGIFSLALLADDGGRLYTYSDPAHHVIEAVAVAARPVPKKLPTRVDPKKKSGVFVCLNADASDISLDKDIKTAKVQVFAPDKMVGEVAVAEDGSFNIEVQADTPLRFATVDSAGNVLRGPSAWMWVRPGEHRGCTGCHEDREMAPENYVPKSLKNGPVSLVKEDISIEKSHE